MRNKRCVSIIAVICAVVIIPLIFSFLFSHAAFSEIEESGDQEINLDSLKIFCDGREIGEKAITSTDKVQFTAEGVVGGASYQWQIMNLESSEWVNIEDKLDYSCDVSVALIDSILFDASHTVIRCIAEKDGIQYISNSVVVVLYESEEIINFEDVTYATALTYSEPMTVAADEGDDSFDKVTVTIEYKLDGEILFNSYVATLRYGSSFSSNVPSPSFIGYEPFTVDSDGEAVPADIVKLSYANITENKTVTVEYLPGKVSYRVKYFLQNITDDNYIEDFTLSYDGKDYTGSYPEDDIEKEISGFTSLFHIPALIAADGSTVFECYYDRNYYLYSFDCNGGYGTDSVYARYGTHLVVPRPMRAGYVFAGWDEKTDTYPDGDGSVDELPTSIDAGNRSYIAVWEPVLTTVKIVYWNENPDDDGYNYWDSRIIHTMSGTEIKAGDILAPCRMHNTMDDGSPAYTVEADSGTVEEHGAELLKDATYHNYWASNGEEGTAWFTVNAHDITHPTLDCIALDLSDAYTYMDADRMKVDIDVDVTYKNGAHLYKTFKDICLSEDFTLNKQTEQTSPITSIKFTFKNRKQLTHGEWEDATFEFRCAEVEIFSETSVPISVIPNTDTVSSNEFNQYLLNEERTTQIAEGMYNNAEKTAIIVEGDGSTVINVYYKRQKYHFRMIYARTYLRSGVETWQVAGYTQEFGGLLNDVYGHDGSAVTQEYTYELSDMLTKARWGDLYKDDEHDGVPTLIDETKYKIETFDAGIYTYYALNITVKYGQSLKDIYPIDVFAPIYSPKSPWGNYIVHSSWTGEPYVRYSFKANAYGQANKYIRTIKGKFIRAEGDMLYEDGTPFTDGRKYVDEKYVTWTYSADYTDRYVLDSDGNRIINYVAYWANNIMPSYTQAYSWNIPVQWHYNTYLEALPDEVKTLPDTSNTGEGGWVQVKEAECGKGVYLNKIGWQYTDGAGKVYRYVDGVYYVLYDSYYAYDNNIGNGSSAGLVNQTATETKGYTLKYKRYGGTYTVVGNYDEDHTFEEVLKIKSTSHNAAAVPGYFTSNGVTTDGMTGCIGNYYYTRDDYELRLYNQGEYLTDTFGTTQSPLVAYEENLNNAMKDYFGLSGENQYVPTYPASLEAGAYEFGGWYTSPLFFAGTEVTDLSVMKATPMTLYAQWKLVTHTVNFYNSYADLNDSEKLAGPFEVSHGGYVNTSDIPDPEESLLEDGEEYLFIGWFYFNSSGEKTAYDPGSVPVLTSLELFAEWYSSTSVQYKIRYVDQNNVTLCDDTDGMTYVGITRTFEAKPYYELDGGGIVDSTRYYPLINSQSIIVSKNAEDNEITFVYGRRESIDYTVKYVDASTGEEINVDGNGDPVVGSKTVLNCTDAVVTEKYMFIPGYLPDAFYKTRTLTYYETPEDNENVIIFYYTQNATLGRYAVRYWTHDLGSADKDDLSSYSLHNTAEGIGNLGENIVIDISSIRGFTFYKVYRENEDITASVDSDGKLTINLEGNVDKDVIDLYFVRDECQYTVRFVEYGDTDNILHPDVTLTGLYGETGVFNISDLCQVAECEKHDTSGEKKPFEVLIVNGVEFKWTDVGNTEGNYSFTFTEPQTDEDGNDTWPVLFVYYTADTFEIFYVPVTTYPGLGGCDTGPYSETVSITSMIQGSTATPGDGFNFVGWYSDKIFTDEYKVCNDAFFKPNLAALSEKQIYYYALFEPKKTDLTIKKEVFLNDGVSKPSETNDTFIFTVKGDAGTAAEIVDMRVAVTPVDGEGSVTLIGLPFGHYTVTEMTDWSWRYDGTSVPYIEDITLSEEKIYEITFSNKQNNIPWLGGEAFVDNKITAVPTP